MISTDSEKNVKPVRLDIDWGEDGSPFAEMSSLREGVHIVNTSRPLRIDPTWWDAVCAIVRRVLKGLE